MRGTCSLFTPQEKKLRANLCFFVISHKGAQHFEREIIMLVNEATSTLGHKHTHTHKEAQIPNKI